MIEYSFLLKRDIIIEFYFRIFDAFLYPDQ